MDFIAMGRRNGRNTVVLEATMRRFLLSGEDQIIVCRSPEAIEADFERAKELLSVSERLTKGD